MNNIISYKLIILPILITFLAIFTFSCKLFCDEDSFQNYDHLRDIDYWTVDTLELPGIDYLALRKFWGSSADDLYVIGRTSEGFIGAVWHYDGNNWSPVPLHIQQGGFIDGWLWAMDIWGFSEDNVYIVGVDFAVNSDSAFVVHYDGSNWKEIKIEAQGLLSIGGTEPNNIWLGGWHNSELIHYDGNDWTNRPPKLPINHSVSITDITKSSAGITYAIASDGYEENFLISTTGTEWKVEEKHSLQDYQFIEMSNSEQLYSYSNSRGPFRKWNDGQWEEFIDQYQIPHSLRLFTLGQDDLLFSGGYLDSNGDFERGFFHYNGNTTFKFSGLESVLQNGAIYGIWSDGEEIFLASQNIIVDPNRIEQTKFKTLIIHGR